MKINNVLTSAIVFTKRMRSRGNSRERMFESRRPRYDDRDRFQSRGDPYARNDGWARSRRSPVRREEPRHERIRDCARIDRKKTCPMLIRVFCGLGKHHRSTDFTEAAFPEGELRIYTWRDATLRELMALIVEAFPAARPVGTSFDFCVVYPNFKARGYEMRYLGTTCSGQDRAHDTIALDSTKFQVGDCLDVAIHPPRPRTVKL